MAQDRKVGYDNTPYQPNGRWRIHDGSRPQPRVVTPGTFSTAATPGKPPSDATVLLGGGADVSQWKMEDGRHCTWKMQNGVIESGKGMINIKDTFGEYKFHHEWAARS